MAAQKIRLGSQHAGAPRIQVEPEGATREVFTRIRDAVKTAQMDESEFGGPADAASSVANVVRRVVNTIVSEGLETPEQRALVDGFNGAKGLSQVLLSERREPDRAETSRLLGKDEASTLATENRVFDVIGVALHDAQVITLPPIELLRQSIEANIREKSDMGVPMGMLRGGVRAASYIAISEHLDKDARDVASERFGGADGLYSFLLDNIAPLKNRADTAKKLGMDLRSVLEAEDRIVSAVVNELHYADVLDHHPHDYKLLLSSERRD